MALVSEQVSLYSHAVFDAIGEQPLNLVTIDEIHNIVGLRLETRLRADDNP